QPTSFTTHTIYSILTKSSLKPSIHPSQHPTSTTSFHQSTTTISSYTYPTPSTTSFCSPYYT
ncbi:hypothetical protein, partial [Staphylococcus aureus]|uniref:hypothetical protein n=1 Tax=Staphylococcus aureus TaxID=1280 RepID=UPI001C92EA2B